MQEPLASILIIHGYAEHSGRYQNLAQRLLALGYQVLSYDMRGHGNSQGLAGLVPSYEILQEDLAQWIALARPDHGRYFLFGHSMGGGLLAYHVARNPTQALGVILSSPMIQVPDPPKKPLQLLNRVMAFMLPNGKVPAAFYQFDTSALSHIAAEVAAYENDRKVYHGQIRNRTAYELLRLTLDLPDWIPRFRAPVLILHGEKDRLTSAVGSYHFHRDIASSDKTLKIYRNSNHELFNDLCRDSVFADLTQWLNHRTES